MRKYAWSWALSGITAFTVCVGCGDDGDGGGGSYSSGVSPSKQGEDVTQEEAVQFCESFYDYRVAHAPSKAAECRNRALGVAVPVAQSGATDEQIQDVCTAAEESCIEQEEEPAEPPDCSAAVVPTSCTSTVGEIEKCVTDSTNQTNAAINGRPSCSTVTAEQIEQELEEIEQRELPASCQAVQEDCAEVLLRLGIN